MDLGIEGIPEGVDFILAVPVGKDLRYLWRLLESRKGSRVVINLGWVFKTEALECVGNFVDCVPAGIVFNELYEPVQVVRLEHIGEGGLGHCLVQSMENLQLLRPLRYHTAS